MQSINFGFGSTALSFCFYFGQIRGLFCPFWSFGAIFGVRIRLKNNSWNLAIQSINFGFGSTALSFCTFWAFRGYFLGWGHVQKLFCYIPIQTINFGFGSTALSFVFKKSIFGASFALFWALRGYFFALLGKFWGRGQVQIHFWNLLIQTINF